MFDSSDLDRTDYEILQLLQNNARLSNKELADRIGLAPSSTLVRVRALQRCGALTGFYARINPQALGVSLQAMIAVRLEHHTKSDVQSFREHALSLPEVVQLYHVAGANDFLVQVWVRDAEHLRDLTMESFTTRSEVAHLETGLIFEHTTSDGLPVYNEPD